MKTKFDLVILGSGSTAFAAAMTEMRTLGGTCVNRGCLPSKNLIEAARIIWEAAHPRYPGLAPAKMDVNFAELIAQKQEVVEVYRGKKYQSIITDDENIKVFDGKAELLDAHTVRVENVELSGDQILVATGTRPVIPAIEGLDRVPYLTGDAACNVSMAIYNTCTPLKSRQDDPHNRQHHAPTLKCRDPFF